MAPPKKKLSAKEQREAQKQAKQKKLIMILAPILLIAVAIQVPRLLGGGEEESASTDTTAVETTEGGAPAADGGQPAESGTPAPAAPVTGDPTLDQALGIAAPTVARLDEVPDSDPLAPVDETELVSFTTFLASDPFVQLVEPPLEEEQEDEPAEEKGGAGGAEPGSGATDPGSIEILAILEINGTSEVVRIGDAFPLDDPAFKLVAIDAEGSVTFGLVEGSFSSGIETLDLETGKSITLVSQPDGFRYTIRLIQLSEDVGAIEAPPS